MLVACGLFRVCPPCLLFLLCAVVVVVYRGVMCLLFVCFVDMHWFVLVLLFAVCFFCLEVVFVLYCLFFVVVLPTLVLRVCVLQSSCCVCVFVKLFVR